MKKKRKKRKPMVCNGADLHAYKDGTCTICGHCEKTEADEPLTDDNID